MILANAHLIFADRISVSGYLRIADGRIAAVSEQPLAPSNGEGIVDLRGHFLAPGFVDLHIHGALGRDTMEATPDAFAAICRHHAAGGSTALALTTVAAPLDKILAVLKAVHAFRSTDHDGADVLGVHIEGPYFSPAKRGAHLPAQIREPQPKEWEALFEHADVITQMTLAPELPGALPLIQALGSRKIIASGGHSDAWDEDAAAAFAHGMRQVTHTFNCMSSARRRGAFRVAGLLEFAMSEPEILCELIADGFHVSPTLMRMLYQAKGAGGIALVTDATAGAGLAAGHTFMLGDIPCIVREGVAMTADAEALAGSTASMNQLVRNMVNLADVSLVDAVRMATLNPARALGIESKKGALIEGADADLVVLTPDLRVAKTFVRGKCVFESASA